MDEEKPLPVPVPNEPFEKYAADWMERHLGIKPDIEVHGAKSVTDKEEILGWFAEQSLADLLTLKVELLKIKNPVPRLAIEPYGKTSIDNLRDVQDIFDLPTGTYHITNLKREQKDES